MTDESTTATSGAGADTPAEPKNDIQAAAQEVAQPEVKEEPQQPDEEAQKQEEERRGNRTKRYIQRLQDEARQLREQLAAVQTRPVERQATQNTDRGPQLEDFDYDMSAWSTARDAWVIEQAGKRITEQQKQAEEQRRQQEITTSYAQRADEFAATHEDFDEVVGSIAYPLHASLQAAIQAHPRGPEIAYHLGNNDDDAFQLASVQPQLAAAAVERLAARLSAAPAAPQPTALTTQAAPAKPITQAPPPPPTVGGRAATEVPPHKLTDDEWYRRERERTRKR